MLFLVDCLCSDSAESEVNVTESPIAANQTGGT
jgi:hypothetical protein